jgi:hypothetical protein
MRTLPPGGRRCLCAVPLPHSSKYIGGVCFLSFIAIYVVVIIGRRP